VTTDGGKTWHAHVVPGAEKLQFRDVQGVSDKVAYLLSAGPGRDSRIYKTDDGGRTWSLQFQNQDPQAFYDCIAFWTPRNGLAVSDSVNGRFPAMHTTNGQTWQEVGTSLPLAQPGEAAFASSGTCVATQGTKRAWIGTGGAAKARILASDDGGATWAAYDAAIFHGTPSSGILSVDFRDELHGIAGGGDITKAGEIADTIARSSNGGKTWQVAHRPPFPGAVYGLCYAAHAKTGNRQRTVVVTGPSGAAWTPDEGDTWSPLPGLKNYWAVAFANPHAGWLVGTEGRIIKLSF
jgi:photosystem II stability/assembly factor-like uncharacterized protein